jgi:hypothetical protein
MFNSVEYFVTDGYVVSCVVMDIKPDCKGTPDVGFGQSLSEIWVINESLPPPAQAHAWLDSLVRSMQDPRRSDENAPPGMMK